MPKYIKITRSDLPGGYIMPTEEVSGIVEAELDGIEWVDPGTSVTLTVVEMSEQEFDDLPEFEGW